MGKRKALITGVTRQDGSFLAELLLAKDYEVYSQLVPLLERAIQQRRKRVQASLNEEGMDGRAQSSSPAH